MRREEGSALENVGGHTVSLSLSLSLSPVYSKGSLMETPSYRSSLLRREDELTDSQIQTGDETDGGE